MKNLKTYSVDTSSSMNEIGDVAEQQAKISKDTSNSMNEIGDVAEPQAKISNDTSSSMIEIGDVAEPNAKFSQDTSNSMNGDGDVADPEVGIPNNTSLEKSKCPNCQALFKDYEHLVDHFKNCDVMSDEDPSMEALVAKQCHYCGDLVLKENISKHLDGCSQAADLIEGLKCIRCPQKQFKVKRDVYLHVLEIHVLNKGA